MSITVTTTSCHLNHVNLFQVFPTLFLKILCSTDLELSSSAAVCVRTGTVQFCCCLCQNWNCPVLLLFVSELELSSSAAVCVPPQTPPPQISVTPNLTLPTTHFPLPFYRPNRTAGINIRVQTCFCGQFHEQKHSTCSQLLAALSGMKKFPGIDLEFRAFLTLLLDTGEC